MPELDRNQKTIPSGGEAPARGAILGLAQSIRDLLTFATRAEADTWAVDNPLLAVDGRHAWITDEAALCVRDTGAWRRVYPLADWDPTAPTITLAPGATEVTGVSCRRRAGMMHLACQFKLKDPKAAGNASVVLLGTLPDGYRPIGEHHGHHVTGPMWYIDTNGGIWVGYNPAALVTGSTVYVRGPVMLAP